jgi:endonuclease-3 related protein
MDIMEVYQALLEAFGKQGWWPMEGGFEPREWEVCLGAILTQNTSWRNVEKALGALKGKGIVSPLDVIKIKQEGLAGLIKSSGYYNQKAGKLRAFSDFVLGFGGFRSFSKRVEREDLLKVRGIGPETADSILLYALGRPCFVVDAYTRRVFTRLGLVREGLGYEEVRQAFEKTLPRDPGLYKEYHALVVELGKRFCRPKPLCRECPLRKGCGAGD